MQIRFTKMHGAGNDFVVLDETRALLGLSAAQYRWLADRHFGVGADQILSVRPPPSPELDFAYVIHNADGAEVEQCGNGARCFARFVHEQGLSDKTTLKVWTRGGVIAPTLQPDGRVTVDMGAPRFALPDLPFDASGLHSEPRDLWEMWPLALAAPAQDAIVSVALVSMGNPHAVLRVHDVDSIDVATLGPAVQSHRAFVQGVNVGFLQVQSPQQARLRVYERGVGETLACGSGACAAAVAGVRMGWLRSPVDVQMRGGRLNLAWDGGESHVLMTGPAERVFDGNINLPDLP